MRVVIPYKYAADGLELRYAIRSMVKYFQRFSGVLLVGDKPTWYKGEHIPMADIEGNKELSMMKKVLACQDAAFLYSNDDYFALRPFNMDLPMYYDYNCRYMAQMHKQPKYKAMYEACDPNWPNFDVHTPMLMFRGRFCQRVTQMEALGIQTPIKTTYAHGLEGEYLTDLKINKLYTVDELHALVKDRPFFSTHNGAVTEDLIDFLEELYPTKSDYE